MIESSRGARTGSTTSVTAGNEVEVEVEPDAQTREVHVPPDFLEALDRDVEANASLWAILQ